MSFIGATQSVTRGDVVEMLALLEQLRAQNANPSAPVSHEQIKKAVVERWEGR